MPWKCRWCMVQKTLPTRARCGHQGFAHLRAEKEKAPLAKQARLSLGRNENYDTKHGAVQNGAF